MPSEGLPVELLPIIVDFLPRQSRLSLRKVGSSLLLHIVNSKLFREINIEIERQKENIKLINLISDSSCSFTSSLQILRVVCRETHIPIDVQTKFDRGIPNLTNVKKLMYDAPECVSTPSGADLVQLDHQSRLQCPPQQARSGIFRSAFATGRGNHY